MLNSYTHRSEGLLDKMHAGVKFALAVAFILTASFTPAAEIYRLLPLLTVLLVLIILGGLSLGKIISRLLVLTPFIVLAGISLPFITPGAVGGTVPLLGWQWTWEGWHSFLILAGRSYFSLLSLIILSLTTDFPRLLEAFRRFKIPQVLLNSLGLLYRYLFVLQDEGFRMLRARQSRYLGKKPWREPALLGGMVGTLWIRSYLRAERVAHAMEARGGLSGRMLSVQYHPANAGEWIMLGMGIALCLAELLAPAGWVGL
jgi:cobalt/nickel transport system permease protein